MTKKNLSVGCYYFPNYHFTDERNTAYHGPGWSEWDVVRNARPRFEGHRQPKRPLWGYEDESDPEVMSRKIAAAVTHGIDYFIFDYYYYNDGPFLENCLNNGFLQAENPHPLRFALMWANHDWLDIHPCGRVPRNLLYPGRVTMETFRILRRRVIERYFIHPAYFRIDGAPYFSIYHLSSFVDSFPDLDAARRALDDFRREAESAGVGGVHLNCVVWGNPVLPCEGTPTGMPEVVRRLGFDSITSYVWIHHSRLEATEKTSYGKVEKDYFSHWDRILDQYHVPYFPNVSVGWDASPRTLQSDRWTPGIGYPYTSVVVDNTPEHFQAALERCAKRSHELGIPTMNINSWNEWTEGSMLEPEEEHGMGYLEAIRSVFSPGSSDAC